jgi:hypothetical protein
MTHTHTGDQKVDGEALRTVDGLLLRLFRNSSRLMTSEAWFMADLALGFLE